jgi:hypothetical protein
MPSYRLHDTTGDDLGTIEHPASDLEAGDVVVLEDGREYRGRSGLANVPGFVFDRKGRVDESIECAATALQVVGRD